MPDFCVTTRLKFLARCLVSISLLVLVVRKVDWLQLRTILAQLDLVWASLASALTGLLITLLAMRWRIFLRQQGLGVPFSTLFGLTWAGQFFNAVLPGSTGGDVVKIYQLCHLEPHRKAAAAATVFADRLSALFALLVLAVIGFVMEPLPLKLLRAQGFRAGWLAAAVIGSAVFGGIALLVALSFLRRTQWLGRIHRTLEAAKKTLTFSLDSAVAVGLAFALHFLNFLIVFLFAKALGLNITYPQMLLIMPVVLLLVMLPVTINGHGLRELLLIGYFTGMGIGIAATGDALVREIVVALSVVFVANDLLWSLPGGLWYLVRGGGQPPHPEAVS